ncbi:MAG TPA: hypothetical protein PK765_06025 [bacterium]|nr:hypothetical protein [bacterium]
MLTIPKLIAQLVRSGMISASVSERLTKALLHLEPEIRAGAARIAQELPRAAEKTATSVR